jgi:tetratricopeptide (TPR) repeat protein
LKKIVPWIVVAAVLIGIGLVSGHRHHGVRFTKNKAAYEAYEKGDNQLVSFQLAPAEENLRRAIALDPGFAMAHAALAHLLSVAGRTEEVKPEIAIAESLASGIADPLPRLLVQVRLSAFTGSRYYADADSLLKAGKAIDPNQIIFLVAEASDDMTAGEFEAAKQVWKRVLELNPNYAEAYNYLGYLSLNLGHYDDAKDAMHKYAFVSPDLANPHDSLGEVLATIGEYEAAEREFKRALEKQPTFFWSLINLGMVYLDRGEIDRGLSLLEQVRDQIKGTAWEKGMDVRVINALYIAGMMDEVEQHTSRYVAQFPDDLRTPLLRAYSLAYRDRPQQVKALLDSVRVAAAKNPDYGSRRGEKTDLELTIQRMSAVMAAVEGDTAQAAATLTSLLDAERRYPPHRLIADRICLARYLHALHQDDAAAAEVDTVLAINPRQCSALVVAVRAQLGRGDEDTARKFLELLERSVTLADSDYPPLIASQQLRARFGLADRAAR